MVRTTFESPDYPKLFLGKNTHDPALNFVMSLLPFTTDEHTLFELVKSGLPQNYNGDTLKEIKDIISWGIKHGFDELTKEKESKSQSQLLLDLVEEESFEFFHDNLKTPYIRFKDNNKTDNAKLFSTKSKLKLQHIFYKKYGRPINDQQFKQAISILAAKSTFDHQEEHVFLRVAGLSNGIAINLANKDKQCAIITEDGVDVTDINSANFISSPAMMPLSKPIVPDKDILEKFQNLLGLSDRVFYCILAFLINTLKPNGPYFCLIIEGEQGSGKSFLAECIKNLVDPSKAPKLRLPNNERDLMIQAKDNHLLVFDNVSSIKGDISDALCSLSTGSGFATRKLYSDEELIIFSEARPYILNGISSFANRPDLIERAIYVHLEAMPKEKRKTEAEIKNEFEKLKPAILGEFYRLISYAIRKIEDVETPRNFRMADSAKWILAAETGTKYPKGTLLASIEQSQNDIFIDSLQRDSLALALIKIANSSPFEGTMGRLFEILDSIRPSRHDKYYPSSSASLSRRLDRLKPSLLKTGIAIEFGKKTNKGKMVRVSLLEENNKEAPSTHPLERIPI